MAGRDVIFYQTAVPSILISVVLKIKIIVGNDF